MLKVKQSKVMVVELVPDLHLLEPARIYQWVPYELIHIQFQNNPSFSINENLFRKPAYSEEILERV